jgi:hypothetical protein
MTVTRNVALPEELCSAVEKMYADKFGSLEELLIVVLRSLERDEASMADQAEERMVEERLRELGYL